MVVFVGEKWENVLFNWENDRQEVYDLDKTFQMSGNIKTVRYERWGGMNRMQGNRFWSYLSSTTGDMAKNRCLKVVRGGMFEHMVHCIPGYLL